MSQPDLRNAIICKNWTFIIAAVTRLDFGGFWIEYQVRLSRILESSEGLVFTSGSLTCVIPVVAFNQQSAHWLSCFLPGC